MAAALTNTWLTLGPSSSFDFLPSRELMVHFFSVPDSRGGFLVAVLDIGTIFEVKFQRVRAQNMSFWLVESDFYAQITLEN